MLDKIIDVLDTVAIYSGWITGTVEGTVIKHVTKFEIWFEKECRRI